MEKTNYMTPQCHKALLDELNQLLRIERPEVCRVVQWAAGNGDRSENADYQYGKKRLREIDRRLRFLNKRLEAAQVIDPASIQSEKIQFGATVTAQDGDGRAKRWSIVGVDEVATERGHISWQSPIGRALLGKTVGDEIQVQTPAGILELEITDVRYQSLEDI